MAFQFKWLSSIHNIDARTWQAIWSCDYPFVQYSFLAALEDSGTTSPNSGWAPQHLAIFQNGQDKNDQCVGLMIGYLKKHSYGEYVFDWGWADAYHRSGRQYYPKWISAIPFTPATGPRLASLESVNREELIPQIIQFLNQSCVDQGLSSWHCLFPEADLGKALLGDSSHAQGSLKRLGCQFHWYNKNYKNFDEFLGTFNSRKRKSLKRERRQVQESGVVLTRLTGSQINNEAWNTFYHFYHLTYLKRSGSAGYLNRDFFELLHATNADNILLVSAKLNNEMIAGALYFFDSTTLYGRYWGCNQEVDGLHFETCYYQGIEFAIEKGLQRFDPGAQGEHKIQRGFTPTITTSNHWLKEPIFFDAVEDFLKKESAGVIEYQKECSRFLPFKN